jgi:hypothetical protein
MGQKTDELVANGIVRENLDKPGFILFDVSFSIPVEAVEAGAFELFASHYGWAPTIVKSTPEEPIVTDADGQAVMIPNPITAPEAGSAGLKAYTKNVLERLLLEQGAVLGRQKAQQEFNALDI